MLKHSFIWFYQLLFKLIVPIYIPFQKYKNKLGLPRWCSEKAMVPYSSTLAWKTPGTEEPRRLQFMGSLTQLSNFTFTFHFHALEKAMAPHSSVFAWRIPGMGERDGLPSMGSHRVGHN